MYVSAPTIFRGVTLPPVQTKSVMTCAVSGWLDLMKFIIESRARSCMVCPEGLGIAVRVGVGIGVGKGVRVGLGTADGVGGDAGSLVGDDIGVAVGN